MCKLKVTLTNISFIKSVINYNSQSFRGDLVAGITVAVIALPQSMAYAIICGVNPIYGIYTAIVATILCGLLSDSLYINTGITNGIAMVLNGLLSEILTSTHPDSLFMITFATGLFSIMLFVFKAGKAIKFIPKSIIIGFTAGAGIAAALGQIAPLMGIRLNASNFTPIAKAYYTISDIGNLNVYALIPGLITILLIIAFQKINSKIPGALIGMTISTLLVIVFHFSKHNINLVGSIPLVIPKLYFFDISFSNFFLILNAGFVIALIGNIETISSLEFSANKTGEKIDVNKEILSQGLINFFSSFFQCLPSSGTLTRTAINCLNGAKTNLSNIFSGLFALLIVLLFSNYIKYLPISCLAGVIIVVAFRIVNFNDIKAIIRKKDYDTFLLMTTLCIPIITGRLDYSIYCGILLAVLHKFSKNIIKNFKVAK